MKNIFNKFNNNTIKNIINLLKNNTMKNTIKTLKFAAILLLLAGVMISCGKEN